MKMYVYLDADGQWRWTLIARNNRKIASSGESFDSKSNALRAANRLRRMFHYHLTPGLKIYKTIDSL